MQSDTPAGTDRPLQGTRILLVEDEVIIAMDLTMGLEGAGATVTHARTQAKGISFANEIGIDAAILDVNLGNGATCKPIAEALRRRGVPFLLHTGDLQASGELVDLIDAPVAQKPMSSAQLIEMLLQFPR